MFARTGTLRPMADAEATDRSADARTLGRGLERFRDLRREIESAVLPLATSIDGRAFSFQASLHGLELRLGGYVVLEYDGRDYLGQVLALELDQRAGTELDLPAGEESELVVRTEVPIRHARGDGVILDGDGTPIHDATVRPATATEVGAWIGRSETARAKLEIGELAFAPGVPCRLDAGGFDRHTFICGQSGSGKTYSLGVILEQLLAQTKLRIIVLDPNSDFVRLSTIRPGVDAATSARYEEAARGIAVYSGRASGARPLRVRLAELSPAAHAALLRLDPIADSEEHAELDALLAQGTPPTVAALLESPRPEARRLALRARNLGVDGFSVWPGSEPGSILDAIDDPEARCVVVDLGSLGTIEEQSLVAGAVLGRLWQRRERREPVLIVVDEAHNVCPALPEDPLTAIATKYAVRIAAEGRKFGLYLAVSTQRPQKVHENVISQCDNLVLMRLNSVADTTFAQAVFSFVAPTLIGQATTFRLGEALVAGKISPHPALLRFGARVAEEGGSDVPSTWALGRPA